MQESNRPDGLKVFLALLVFIGCVIAFSLSQSWISYLLFGVGALASGEYLADKLFGQTWFQRLSVEHAGFSVARIIVGVLVVLIFTGLIFLGRMLFLQMFH